MPGHLKGVARRLRGAPTSAERVLWRELRKKQIGAFRFRRQVVLCGFIVDFACYEARLVIEVDGATHSTPQEIERDAARDARLRMAGNAVLRFTNDELFSNIDGVLETIRLRLNELRPRFDVEDTRDLHDTPP
jgi:very-short-patch-repair endonuclease